MMTSSMVDSPPVGCVVPASHPTVAANNTNNTTNTTMVSSPVGCVDDGGGGDG